MRVRLSGSGRTGKSEGCLSIVSKYATWGVHSLRAKRMAPRVPRSTSTAPASPRSNGMQRTGRTGTPKISAPTRASEPARIFEDQRGAAGPCRVQARAPQYKKTIPTAIKAAGRVGNPTRPETASRIRRAPRSKTIDSFRSWKSFADVSMRSSYPVLDMVRPPWATDTSRELPDIPQLAGPWHRGHGMIQLYFSRVASAAGGDFSRRFQCTK